MVNSVQEHVSQRKPELSLLFRFSILGLGFAGKRTQPGFFVSLWLARALTVYTDVSVLQVYHNNQCPKLGKFLTGHTVVEISDKIWSTVTVNF